MTTSLTILLPVYNAENRLEAQVGEILDVLPELTSRFDVLIVDDGSVDDTAEVAASLSRNFPQVRTIRHPIRLGIDEAVQTGLGHTTGEVVFVGDEKYGLDPSDLRKLWQLRENGDAGAGPESSAQPTKKAWLARLIDWDHQRTGGRAHLSMGLQMIRRDHGSQKPGGRATEPKQPNYLDPGRRIIWRD